MTINDQPVLVNEKGEFSQDVGLKDGLNVINVRAKNKFNKETTQSVSVSANFQPTENQPDRGQVGQPANSSDQQNNPVKAEISVAPNPTWLSVEADSSLVYSGVLDPQNVQKFEAKEKISVSSGNGRETFVKINGKDLGQLTSSSAPAKDIVFDANGKVLNK